MFFYIGGLPKVKFVCRYIKSILKCWRLDGEYDLVCVSVDLKVDFYLNSLRNSASHMAPQTLLTSSQPGEPGAAGESKDIDTFKV